MRYRVRTWDGQQPLPYLDVTTSSVRVMLGLCEERAESYGWENVSLAEAGQRPLKGEALRGYCEGLRARLTAERWI